MAEWGNESMGNAECVACTLVQRWFNDAASFLHGQRNCGLRVLPRPAGPLACWSVGPSAGASIVGSVDWKAGYWDGRDWDGRDWDGRP
jgi:hypothetical protein